MIINTVPHQINIYNEAKELVLTLPPAETPARLAVEKVYDADFDGVPLFETRYGDVENLPPFEFNTLYVVSLLLRNALPNRFDLYSPGELLRDDTGKPIGCIGLTR